MVASRAVGKGAVSQRVLIYGINYAPEPIGVGRYTADIGTYLAKQGVKVDVVTAAPHYPGWVIPGGYRNRYSVEIIGNVRVTRCPIFLKKQMRGVWRAIAPFTFAATSAPVAVWRILTRRPNTVLCIEPTLFCAPAALLAAKLVGARTVLHVQDLEIDAAFAIGHLHNPFLQQIANRIEQIVLSAFDAIITISNRMKERLEAKKVEAKRIFIIRNWIDLDQLKPLTGKSPYRQEFGFSDGNFIALYAGNIGPKQALHVVLEAAKMLVGNSSISFVIAGEGPEKARLYSQYGHLPNVLFLPIQPEARLCELLNFPDAHLLPQDVGAGDLVLPSKLGGMIASGKCCIVMADYGTELHEFLEGTAILLPPGDSVGLANAVERAAKSGETGFGKGGRVSLEKFDARNNLKTLQGILNAS